MKVKLFEMRDVGTNIGLIAIQLDSSNEAERHILARAGYGIYPFEHQQYVLMARVDGGVFHYDHLKQDHPSRQIAHHYIQQFWSDLESGQVIDVEYIQGITKEPKKSDRFYEAPEPGQ